MSDLLTETTTPEWMSAKEAAKVLGGVSDKLIYKLYHKGELEGAKIGDAIRLRAASIAAYLDAHSNKTKKPSPMTTARLKVNEKIVKQPRRKRRQKAAFEFQILTPTARGKPQSGDEG